MSRTKPSERVFEEEYDVLEEIGQGGFAHVYKAKRKTGGPDFAVRICSLNGSLELFKPNIPTIERLVEEFDTCTRLASSSGWRNEYLSQLEDFFVDPARDRFITISLLCTGGDMFERITTHPLEHYTEDEARAASRSLFTAIASLHSEGCIHRDIKPENILYSSKESSVDQILVIDFGCLMPFAKRDEFYESDLVGTPGYLPPEMIANRPYNMLVDEWSAGITVYEMLTGRSPLISDNKEDLMRETLERAIPFPKQYWRNISPEARDFTSRLLQKDARRRMSAEEALKHPWLQQKTLEDGLESDSGESDSDASGSIVLRKTTRSRFTYMPSGVQKRSGNVLAEAVSEAHDSMIDMIRSQWTVGSLKSTDSEDASNGL